MNRFDDLVDARLNVHLFQLGQDLRHVFLGRKLLTTQGVLGITGILTTRFTIDYFNSADNRVTQRGRTAPECLTHAVANSLSVDAT